MGLGGAGDVVKAVRDTEQERPNSAVQCTRRRTVLARRGLMQG